MTTISQNHLDRFASSCDFSNRYAYQTPREPTAAIDQAMIRFGTKEKNCQTTASTYGKKTKSSSARRRAICEGGANFGKGNLPIVPRANDLANLVDHHLHLVFELLRTTGDRMQDKPNSEQE